LSSKTSTSGRRPGGSDRASEAGDARRNRVAWLTNDSRGVSDWPARYELLSDDRRTLGRRHRAPARAHRGRPAYCCPLSVHRRPGPVPGRRDQRGETRPEMDQRLLGGGLLLHRRLASRAGGGPPGDPGRTGGPPAVARRRSGRMMGHWQLAAVMAPSAALAWGISLGRLGLPEGLAGAAAGAIMGVLGSWLLARRLERAEQSGHWWYRWAVPYLTLLLL